MRQEKKDATCRHYEGCQHEKCAAGIVLVDFNGGDRTGFVKKLPCFGAEGFGGMMNEVTATCDKYSSLTEQELADREKDWEDTIAKTVLARLAITEHSGGKHGVQGELPCPVCETGTLRYSIAGVNGHCHASCSTKDCVRWTE